MVIYTHTHQWLSIYIFWTVLSYIGCLYPTTDLKSPLRFLKDISHLPSSRSNSWLSIHPQTVHPPGSLYLWMAPISPPHPTPFFTLLFGFGSYLAFPLFFKQTMLSSSKGHAVLCVWNAPLAAISWTWIHLSDLHSSITPQEAFPGISVYIRLIWYLLSQNHELPLFHVIACSSISFQLLLWIITSQRQGSYLFLISFLPHCQ